MCLCVYLWFVGSYKCPNLDLNVRLRIVQVFVYMCAYTYCMYPLLGKPEPVSASALCSISVSGAAGAVAPMQVSHQLRDAAELARQHRGTLQTYLV